MSRPVVYHRFTEKDDEKLLALVKQYGAEDWKLIASKMHGRNKRQCRDRWFRFLAPDVNHDPWTKEEEDLLIDIVPKLEPRWRQISSYFKGRNDIQVKNRYKSLMRRMKSEKSKSESNENPQILFTDFNTDIDINDDFRIFDDMF
ncbi:Myb-like DNA-binding domain containing protein [Trichomonas vaginalis G3]|uniref:Myb-like DNA-binding domain containing protein n=1 Tax=Trichomonas vaginalis (strain ATCC PRA-98 / G3) TaxID=412133 RepID=A2E0T4_TRIV3|nr:RNA polymerase II transcription regulator recruiting protein [Trichomonas vaginalis G3]EAY13689.1 Myb-like DNA-binding domain containing protein [Trichomonas vaginalis G3]KAI5529599.1 RNA polymerase II transcription regulator recruiting protein [Trichomonas vaginalis G3]|eukprot:XP_001325912.1 Myb-like DNA-binding domain containing protein [Trichomonas vaginalis G3]